MKFELPPLNYSADALAPQLSPETIEYHHGKHHLAYVNNLNNLVPGTPYEEASLETMIKKAEGGIFNNAAQIWNHTFYFATFSPSGLPVHSGAGCPPAQVTLTPLFMSRMPPALCSARLPL